MENNKKLILIYSKYNLFTRQVKKMVEDSIYETHVINIEDFVLKDEKIKINNNDVVYFMCCNSRIIDKAIELIEGGYIINKNFLLQKYKKLDLQNKLNINNILIPKIYSASDVDKISFPIICKENIHQGITIELYNEISWTKFFEKFNKEDFYLEEALNNSNEIKIYYINGEVYLKDDTISQNYELNVLAKNISKCLNDIEVYSCDIVIVDNLYYVIDFNASAGFHHSNENRKRFIKYVGEK